MKMPHYLLLATFAWSALHAQTDKTPAALQPLPPSRRTADNDRAALRPALHPIKILSAMILPLSS